MASPSISATSVPEDSIDLAIDPTSPNPENTSFNSPDRATSRLPPSFEAKMKAFHLSRQGAQSAQHQGGAGSIPDSPAADSEGRKIEGRPHGSINPGGPKILPPSSLVGARDEQTPTGDTSGDTSGDTQDVTSKSDSLSDPQTGTKKDQDNEGEAMDSASRVRENEDAEVASK